MFALFLFPVCFAKNKHVRKTWGGSFCVFMTCCLKVRNALTTQYKVPIGLLANHIF